MPYGTVNADVIQTSTSGGILGAGNASIMKNRIINGAMVIDQRNAGASVTQSTSVVYTLDRFNIFGSVASKFTCQQNAGSVTPPIGFSKYLGITSSSAYTVGASEVFRIAQPIEGFNTADLAWGTANAKTVTLSFQVYSSLTGTFGGSLTNENGDRSYPFTYTISSANTWTSASVTIAGDTTGTWVGATNGVGIYLFFGLGVGSTNSGTAGAWAAANYRSATGAVSVVGTSGATFYITGVQLEVGSSATGYEYRQYQQELSLCQRYFSIIGNVYFRTYQSAGTVAGFTMTLPVALRSSGTATVVGSASLVNTSGLTIDTYSSSNTNGNTASLFYATWGSAGDGRFAINTTAYVTFSAEL
jgi:hypothetical protein